MATGNSVYFAAQSAATQGIGIVTAALETPIAWIRYLGATDSGATFEIDDTTGDWEFTTDGTTADTTIGIPTLDGTIDVSDAAGNTFADVIAAVNASSNWQGYMLGVRPEDVSTNTSALTTEIDLSTAAMKETGLFVFGDEVVSYDVAYAVSGFDPSKSTTEHWDDTNCANYLTYANVTCDFTTAGTFKVYSANQTTSTLIKSVALVDNTATLFGSAGVDATFAQSKLGERLIVMSVSDADASTDSLHCSGHSVDYSGERYNNGYSITNVNA
ncbi:MAG: hypothetical protein KAS32_12760 [Candidatus Peribacteraceae bacterium]|nr:hypothetical protein [Candidatus Peribacteraceae bacterium]